MSKKSKVTKERLSNEEFDLFSKSDVKFWFDLLTKEQQYQILNPMISEDDADVMFNKILKNVDCVYDVDNVLTVYVNEIDSIDCFDNFSYYSVFKKLWVLSTNNKCVSIIFSNDKFHSDVKLNKVPTFKDAKKHYNLIKLSMFSDLLVDELCNIDSNIDVPKKYHIELIEKATGRRVYISTVVENFINSMDNDFIKNLPICDNWVKITNCDIIKDAIKFYNDTTNPVLVENAKRKERMPF